MTTLIRIGTLLGAATLALWPHKAPAQSSPAPAAAASATAIDTLERLRKRGTILLGHREAAVPFSYLIDNQPRGYSVQLCLQVVEGLKRRLGLDKLEVQWVRLQAAERLPAVRDGRVDLECGNTTATAERRKTVAFTTPIFIAGAGVLARADSKAGTLQDLKGKRIAVAAGTTGEKVVQKANEAAYGIVPVVVKDNAEAFAALEKGQAQAWITDDVLLAAYRAQAADPALYVLLDKRHTIEPLALMMRKDDAAFERAVDSEIATLFRNGQVQALYERWFQRATPPKGVNLDLPPGRLLREIFRLPLKLQNDLDVIVL
jgi:ABC-type amino acid transport substrate-binding protein